MFSGFPGAGNATQTMPAISPSVTVISTASATPRAVIITIFYYTDVILISLFLFVVILLRLPRALAPFWSRSGRTGLGRQRQAAATHFNHDIHHTASHQYLSTDRTHVNCSSYQWHLDLGTYQTEPSSSLLEIASSDFYTYIM
ncbi:hypothetical protein K435DRAFT_859916 [Dendrothele bispora CBS 962.96]|uniref:Uncharacterized protein n=1 Tax=Dendrothele bispora (strain CBS 962.96) TaxID=1314807 RepID=A0A4V4HFI4_DENBC|nr:hypothetical protein K435DRAFT_859916 [Dendrothele bispora CBS 962.96]